MTELEDGRPKDEKQPYQHIRAQISPDGLKVAAIRTVGEEHQVVVWEMARPAAPRVLARLAKAKPPDKFDLTRDRGPFAALRFTPDSKRVSFATPDRKFYRVIDLAADMPPATVELPITENFASAEWHPTAPLLAIVETTQAHRQRVVLWDVDRKAVRATCGEDRIISPGFGATTIPVAFSHDGNWLAVSGSDPVVHIYRTLDGAEWLRIDVASALSMGVNLLAWNAHNQLCTGGYMEGLKVWGLESPSGSDHVLQIKPADRPAFSPDSRWLAVFSQSGKVRGASAPVLSGAELTPANDRVALIDRRTREVRFLPGHDTTKGAIVFAPDSQRLVIESTREIVVRKVDTGDEVLRRRIDKTSKLSEWRQVFFEPGGRLMAFGQFFPRAKEEIGLKGTVVLWDVAADKQVPGFPEFTNEYFGPAEGAVAADGSRYLLVGSTIEAMFQKKLQQLAPTQLFEIPSGRVAAEVNLQTGTEPNVIFPARLGPGGRRLLALHVPLAMMTGRLANFADVQWTVRELETGQVLLQVPIRTISEEASDFGPGASRVALGVDRGYVELWDLEAKALLFRWQPHGGNRVMDLAIAPDGDIATVAEGDDALVVLRYKEVKAKLTELGLGW